MLSIITQNEHGTDVEATSAVRGYFSVQTGKS